MDDEEVRRLIALLIEYVDGTPLVRDRLPFVVAYLLARLRAAAILPGV